MIKNKKTDNSVYVPEVAAFFSISQDNLIKKIG